MRRPTTDFPLPSEVALRSLLERVGGALRLASDGDALERGVFLDTFDRRLLRAGHTLEAIETGERWRLTLGGEDGAEALVPRLPERAAQLAPSGLRDRLESLARSRRLVPVALLERRLQAYELREQGRRIEASVFVAERRALPPGVSGVAVALPCVLRVCGLAGHEEDEHRLLELLERELGPRPSAARELEEALLALGPLAAGASAPALGLRPETPAGEAARTALSALAATMRALGEGVRASPDIECLHEFRVALRRSRSVLAEIRGVFPPAVSRHFAAELRWLGSETGAARDLDVLAAALPRYVARLPQPVRADLEPLVRVARDEARRGRERLAAVLVSERHRELVRSWEALLAAPAPPDLDEAREPIAPLVRARVRRRLRRVRKGGRRLERDSPQRAYHEVRIQAKKLRYLLEVFADLHDAGELAPWMRRLRRFQNALGALNDLVVHGAMLRRTLARWHVAGEAPLGSLLAAGRLLGRLERDERRARETFRRRFRRLDRKGLLTRAPEPRRR